MLEVFQYDFLLSGNYKKIEDGEKIGEEIEGL